MMRLTILEEKQLYKVDETKIPIKKKYVTHNTKNRNEYMRNYNRIRNNIKPENTKVIWRMNLKYIKSFQMCSSCHLIKFIKSDFYPNQYTCKSCHGVYQCPRN